jgi:cytochrome c5
MLINDCKTAFSPQRISGYNARQLIKEILMVRTIFGALIALVAVAATSVYAVDLSEAQLAEIEERIKPVGESCLTGDSDCGGAATAAAGGDAARSGEDVYNAACMACHMTGAAGAPKLGDVAAWTDRLAKGNDALYSSGIDGLPGTGMMAKGGCMNCSDEEVKAAVDYMIEGSQ